MFKTIKPCTSPVKIIDIISQKGKLSPRDLNFIHLELSRYIKLSFYLYSQFLNVFQRLIEFLFVWTATAQFECYISC